MFSKYLTVIKIDWKCQSYYDKLCVKNNIIFNIIAFDVFLYELFINA